MSLKAYAFVYVRVFISLSLCIYCLCVPILYECTSSSVYMRTRDQPDYSDSP